MWKTVLKHVATLGLSYLVEKAAGTKARKTTEELLEEFEARYRAEEEARFKRIMSDSLAQIAAAEKGMAESLARNDAKLAQDAKAARDRRRK